MQFRLRLPPSSIFCLLAGIFLLLCTRIHPGNGSGGDAQTHDQYGERRMRRDYVTTPNVSCIAHDTKFTCDCKNANEHMMLPHLNGYVFHVEVRNCRSLDVGANSLVDTQGLRTITFRNIGNLVLRKYSLAFPQLASNTPLIIEFEKVNFEMIDSHAINGNIEEISFIGGRIDVIRPFGFTTLKDRAILLKMDNLLVDKVEPQAFKKFTVDQMEITNSVFSRNLPSKCFYELEVLNSLRIFNVTFMEVHSRAFSFKVISKLSIVNNTFDAVDGEWIEAHVRDSALIKSNFFGMTSPIAFKGIRVHRDYLSSERLEMRFANNTVRFPYEPRALEFNDRFAVNINYLQYQNRFSCKDVDTSAKPPKPKVLFFQTFSEAIYFQRATSKSQSLALSKIIESDCRQPSYLLYIILFVVGLLLILAIIAAIVGFQIAKKRKKRKIDVVMPEPRTYKETQIVYQIENAGLLKTDL